MVLWLVHLVVVMWLFGWCIWFWCPVVLVMWLFGGCIWLEGGETQCIKMVGFRFWIEMVEGRYRGRRLRRRRRKGWKGEGGRGRGERERRQGVERGNVSHCALMNFKQKVFKLFVWSSIFPSFCMYAYISKALRLHIFPLLHGSVPEFQRTNYTCTMRRNMKQSAI